MRIRPSVRDSGHITISHHSPYTAGRLDTVDVSKNVIVQPIKRIGRTVTLDCDLSEYGDIESAGVS